MTETTEQHGGDLDHELTWQALDTAISALEEARAVHLSESMRADIQDCHQTLRNVKQGVEGKTAEVSQ